MLDDFPRSLPNKMRRASEELLPREVFQPPFLIWKLPFSQCPLHSLDILEILPVQSHFDTDVWYIHTYICLCVYTYVYTYPLSRAAQVLMSLFTYVLCPICSTLVSNYIWIWLPLSSCKYMTLIFWFDIVKGKDFLSFVTKGFSKVSGCSDL